MNNTSDISVHRALVIRSSDSGIYVKIPSLLGANESISLHQSSSVSSNSLSEGSQILVGIEGDNFNKVYYITKI